MDAARAKLYFRFSLRALVALAIVILSPMDARARPVVPGAVMPARANSGQEVDLPLVSETLRVDVDQQHATTVVSRVYTNVSSMRVEGRLDYRTGDEVNVA